MLLLINDDGIDAPGLAALERAVEGLGPWVVLAPDQHLSGCGHQATTHRPLALTQRGPGRYMLDGTPADCTRVGLTVLAPGSQWVISGINEGANLGADVYMSGTVAAVREAALLGRPGIAVSQYVRREMPVDWSQAAAWAKVVVERLMADAALHHHAERDGYTGPHHAERDGYQGPGVFWSVNLPHCPPGTAMPEWVVCPLDPSPMPVEFHHEDGRLHYRGNYHQRARRPGCDVDVCFSGRIAVTRLAL